MKDTRTPILSMAGPSSQPAAQSLRTQQQIEIDTMEVAVREAAARRREQQERRAVIISQLRDDLHHIALSIRARHELEHAALERELRLMLPSAMKEWRSSEAEMLQLVTRLRAGVDGLATV